MNEISIRLPKNEKETLQMKIYLQRSNFSENSAILLSDLCYQLQNLDNKRFKLIEKFDPDPEGPMTIFLRKCIKKHYMKSLANEEQFSIKKCVQAYLARKYYASGKQEESTPAFIQHVQKKARSLYGGLRGQLSNFRKQTKTSNFLEKYFNINSHALEYLYLSGKLKETANDYEILENFLQIAVRQKTINVEDNIQ